MRLTSLIGRAAVARGDTAGLSSSACLAAGLLLASTAAAADWITAPSYYTHDPLSGERVSQYTEIGPYYYYSRPDYVQSGYRHNRSTFQFGGSADNLHTVEEWGRPVRPYDEWRYPFRPYSVPYDAWGPPFGGLGGQGGFYPFPYGPYPVTPGGFYGAAGAGMGPAGDGNMPPDGMHPGGPGHPGHGHGGAHQGPYNTAQPWMDGHYPRYDLNDRSPYYRPYRAERPHVP